MTTAGAQFTWVPWSFLSEQKVRGWSNMPVVVTETPNNVGFSRRDVRKAVAAGLTFRPLAVTAKDTIEWNKTRPKEELDALAQGKTSGISAEREAELLKLWKQQAASSGSTQKP